MSVPLGKPDPGTRGPSGAPGPRPTTEQVVLARRRAEITGESVDQVLAVFLGGGRYGVDASRLPEWSTETPHPAGRPGPSGPAGPTDPAGPSPEPVRLPTVPGLWDQGPSLVGDLPVPGEEDDVPLAPVIPLFRARTRSRGEDEG